MTGPSAPGPARTDTDEPRCPGRVRLCRGYEHCDGRNVADGEYDLPIIYDKSLPTRGQLLEDQGFSALVPRAILLREWDEAVLLHEILHVLLNPHIRPTVDDPDRHRVIAHVEVALMLAGWRYAPGPARTDTDPEEAQQ